MLSKEALDQYFEPPKGPDQRHRRITTYAINSGTEQGITEDGKKGVNKCIVCSKNHNLDKCDLFTYKPLNENEWVSEWVLLFSVAANEQPEGRISRWDHDRWFRGISGSHLSHATRSLVALHSMWQPPEFGAVSVDGRINCPERVSNPEHCGGKRTYCPLH